ncbi:MAG TPA: MerR family transcriptional regulator [Usitatibacter sp.]|jgi:MerR family redox-sensitive transcriptional activator SoxR|nr:MerR family transcriptional regulator [Usitatibacter sp.]
MEIGIGEVARRTGLRPSALRYYEHEGILPRPLRVNGRRRYSEALVSLIEVALFAQSVGFSLAEIKRLFKDVGGRPELQPRWRTLARAKVEELDRVIARALRMKNAIESGLECGCIRVEDCLPGKPQRMEARRKAQPKKSPPKRGPD